MRFFLCGVFVVFLWAPLVALAHEVYVLPEGAVAQALSTPSFSEWQTLLTHTPQFFFWGAVAVATVLLVFAISIIRPLEGRLDPWLAKLPPYAPAVSRIAVGLSFLAGAHYGAVFGPELSLAEGFGTWAPAVSALLAVIGIMIVLGLYTRTAAVVGLCLFAAEIILHGQYLFTYANYAGELIVLLILGAHTVAFHHKHREAARAPEWVIRTKTRLQPYVFPLLRVCFGTSLIYASVYAKVLHNNLALSVTAAYPDVVAFFGFDPQFLVLGAALVEILIGTFFILGIEIRFTSLFLLFWLSLSLLYFGEVVWPHLILIGIPIAFILYGYDQYSLEGRFFRRDGLKPVL